MTVALKINEELNGIELFFNEKPSEAVRLNLKDNGFRWSAFKKVWYTKQNEKALQFANSLVSGVTEEVKTLVNNSKEKKANTKKVNNTLSLWESTQWNDLGINSKDMECKEIAKEIRSHIKKRFPQCKFSVTIPYYGRINFDIKSSPFEKGSLYLNAIKEYCDQLVNAYQICYDAGDSYSDIPASYNFHFFRTDIDYDYTQTEMTEQMKNEMADFDLKFEEAEKVAEEKKHQEFLQWQKEQEQKEVEYKKYQEEEKKQIENIYNSVNVVTLYENKQYFVTGSEFADLNKNNTLDQYKEEVQKGDYSLESVKITKEIHFNNEEALTNFSNLLLNDFDFLANTGGSFTDDERINTMTDYYNMDEEERKTVKWNLNGVAIYFNNELQFVVDAQGYSYARYVGLTDHAKIKKSITVEPTINSEELNELKLQADTLEDISTSVIDELNIIETWKNENWNEYKELFKNKLVKHNFKLTKKIIQQLEIEPLKVAMYKILIEVDSIQEQFKKADIQQGEKVTLFYISDWGSIVTNRITFDSVTNTKYAQYDNAVKITFTPERKRGLHYMHFHSELIVYKGWYSLPDTVLNHVEEKNGYRTTRSKYGSCDHRQYDEILSYFEQQGIKPIINSYKPQF